MAAIGIDLGTTYSCVAVWKNDQCEIIANDQGSRTTPSYVAFTDNERLIGNSAKNQSTQNPENTIFDAKRLIGRNYNDSATQNDIKHFPFKVIDKNNNGKYSISIDNPDSGYTAQFVEIIFDSDSEESISITTGTVITPNKYPHSKFVIPNPKGTR